MAADSILPPNDWRPHTVATIGLGFIGFGIVGVMAVGFAAEEASKAGGRALSAIGAKFPFGIT